MKVIVVFVLLFNIINVMSTPLHDETSSKDAKITDYEFYRGHNNEYHFGFKSSDGTSREEDGYDDENEKLAVNGTISWISQDGSTYHMFFKADNKGFRPIIKRVPPVNKI